MLAFLSSRSGPPSGSSNATALRASAEGSSRFRAIAEAWLRCRSVSGNVSEIEKEKMGRNSSSEGWVGGRMWLAVVGTDVGRVGELGRDDTLSNARGGVTPLGDTFKPLFIVDH